MRLDLRAISALLACAAGLACPAWLAAQSAAPQARVIYPMHAARINQIRATPDFERVVTVGQDKTVRVWRARDLAPLRVIPVPSDSGEEGALRSLAIVADGREVLVGGWTGLSWSGGRQAQIYRFELETGRLLQVLRGFDSSIESMALSNDGRRLAVGLGGRAGLRVLDWPSGRELWADREYGERVSFADFAVDGRLATTSADGCLRLYGPAGELSFRAEYPPRPQGRRQCEGAELGGVRFSPDGRHVAFGLQDRVELVVFDPAAQRIVHRLKVDDGGQRSLCCPNWSLDGRHLHMHGVYAGAGPTPVYRVSLDTGVVERLPVGSQRLTNVLPLPSGDLLVSSAAPGLARVSRSGRVLAEAAPPNGDFRFERDAWRLDEQAQTVLLPLEASGANRRVFSLLAPAEAAFRPARGEDERVLRPPQRSGIPVEAVLDDFGYKHPVRVAGRLLALKPFQSVRAWDSDAGRAVLGTQWSVMVVDAHARVRWEQDLPAPAHQVALSGDGRWVVAAVGDGTLRWYASDSGAQVLGVFLHRNGQDWVAWRPDGSYASSPGGDEYLAWLVNRGDDREPDLLRAVQFERSLYRPDLVRAALRDMPTRGAPAQELGDTLAALGAPRVRIERIDDVGREVRFSVQPGGSVVREIGVYVDGIPVLPYPARRQVPAGAFNRSVTIPPGLPLDRVRVEAEAGGVLGLDEAAAVRPGTITDPLRARLWLLAIGVEKFPDFAGCGTARNCSVRVPELPNAPVDAQVIAAALRERAAGLFGEVRATVLAHRFGAVPTKAAIVAALKELEQAGPEDTVLVFVGSHGFAGGAGAAPEYYFLPADARESSLARLFAQARGQAPPPGSSMDSLLSASELTDALRRVPGRRILAIDTCHAGAAGVSSNPYSIAKRSASSQFAVLSASTGDELSYEYIDPKVPHGGFTYALINGLRGAADGDRDGRTTLDELFAYIGPEVRRNVDALNAEERRQNPRHRDLTQTPVLYASPVLRASVLAGAR